jgi:hypothetical protein
VRGLRRPSEELIENIADMACEQYLTRVYQYVSYWVDNPQLTEELTLRALRKVLVKYRDFCKCENTFSIAVFAAARKEIQSHPEINTFQPAWPGLSSQEREVISLKLGAALDNHRIATVLGLAESSVANAINQSLCKLRGCLEIKQGTT